MADNNRVFKNRDDEDGDNEDILLEEDSESDELVFMDDEQDSETINNTSQKAIKIEEGVCNVNEHPQSLKEDVKVAYQCNEVRSAFISAIRT